MERRSSMKQLRSGSTSSSPSTPGNRSKSNIEKSKAQGRPSSISGKKGNSEAGQGAKGVNVLSRGRTLAHGRKALSSPATSPSPQPESVSFIPSTTPDASPVTAAEKQEVVLSPNEEFPKEVRRSVGRPKKVSTKALDASDHNVEGKSSAAESVSAKEEFQATSAGNKASLPRKLVIRGRRSSAARSENATLEDSEDGIEKKADSVRTETADERQNRSVRLRGDATNTSEASESSLLGRITRGSTSSDATVTTTIQSETPAQGRRGRGRGRKSGDVRNLVADRSLSAGSEDNTESTKEDGDDAQISEREFTTLEDDNMDGTSQDSCSDTPSRKLSKRKPGSDEKQSFNKRTRRSTSVIVPDQAPTDQNEQVTPVLRKPGRPRKIASVSSLEHVETNRRIEDANDSGLSKRSTRVSRRTLQDDEISVASSDTESFKIPSRRDSFVEEAAKADDIPAEQLRLKVSDKSPSTDNISAVNDGEVVKKRGRGRPKKIKPSGTDSQVPGSPNFTSPAASPPKKAIVRRSRRSIVSVKQSADVKESPGTTKQGDDQQAKVEEESNYESDIDDGLSISSRASMEPTKKKKVPTATLR